MSEPTTETAPAVDEAAAPVKKPRGKLFIIIGVVVLLLGGGGGAAFWWLRAPVKAATATKKEPKALDLSKAGIVIFEPFVVNLADVGAKRFLRINIRLLIDKAEEAERIQKSEVLLMRLRADTLELLTTQTSEQIVSPAGKALLRKQIIEHAHATVAPAEVADVLFSDFVVQY
jgi:flagellar FliL protein